MSARPRDVLEQTSRFSLRDVVAAPDTRGVALPPTAGNMFRIRTETAQPAAAAVGPSPGVSMKLNLGTGFQYQQQQATATNLKPAQRPNLSFSFTQPKKPVVAATTAQHTLQNQFQGQNSPVATEQTAQARAEQATHKHDLMRMTAYVDDLTNRLQKQHRRLEATEASLVTVQKELQAERLNIKTQNQAFKKELAVAHETETKLRTELAARPQRSALSQTAFSQAVGTILADEQRVEIHSREVQELEGKLKALGDAKVLIEAEIDAMKKLREKAVLDLEDERTKYSEIKAQQEEGLRSIKVAEEALAVVEARKQKAVTEAQSIEAKSKQLSKENTQFNLKMSAATSTLEELGLKIEAAQASVLEAEATKARADAAKSAAESAAETSVEMAAQIEKQRELRTSQAQDELVHLEQKLAHTRAAMRAAEAECIQAEARRAMANSLPPELIDISETPEQTSENPISASAGDLDDKADSVANLMDAPLPAEAQGLSKTVPATTATAQPERIASGIIHTHFPGHGGSYAMHRATLQTRFGNVAAPAIEGVFLQALNTHVDPVAGAPKQDHDPASKMVEAVVGDLKALLGHVVEGSTPVVRLVKVV